MKKILGIFALTVAALSVGACGQMNTVIRPYTEIKQEIKNVQVIVTRADRSGVYVAVKNDTKDDIEIVWEKSTLGGAKVTQDAYVDKNEYGITRANTVIKPEEILRTVLHRENDIYYLDPVLYQPGGVKVKPLVYPTLLTLKIRKGDVEADSIIYIEHEQSLDKKAVDARVAEEYNKEMKDKDGNYKYKQYESNINIDSIDGLKNEDKKLIEKIKQQDIEKDYKPREDKVVDKETW